LWHSDSKIAPCGDDPVDPLAHGAEQLEDVNRLTANAAARTLRQVVRPSDGRHLHAEESMHSDALEDLSGGAIESHRQ
jgi:hypothetical protein